MAEADAMTGEIADEPLQIFTALRLIKGRQMCHTCSHQDPRRTQRTLSQQRRAALLLAASQQALKHPRALRVAPAVSQHDPPTPPGSAIMLRQVHATLMILVNSLRHSHLSPNVEYCRADPDRGFDTQAMTTFRLRRSSLLLLPVPLTLPVPTPSC